MTGSEVERLAEAERRYRQMRAKRRIKGDRAIRHWRLEKGGVLRCNEERPYIIEAIAMALEAGERRALARLREGDAPRQDPAPEGARERRG